MVLSWIDWLAGIVQRQLRHRGCVEEMDVTRRDRQMDGFTGRESRAAANEHANKLASEPGRYLGFQPGRLDNGDRCRPTGLGDGEMFRPYTDGDPAAFFRIGAWEQEPGAVGQHQTVAVDDIA